MGFRSRARQWSRAAWALSVLFATLPLAARLLLGVWAFEGAANVAFLCAVLGTYLYFVGRRHARLIRDDAALLEEALRLAGSGEPGAAIVRLTGLIRRSPRLWQAYQYRGQLRLREQESWNLALDDLNAAIALAPKEPHLYALRADLRRLLGDEAGAGQDDAMATAVRDAP